jgi:hypothetical protein
MNLKLKKIGEVEFDDISEDSGEDIIRSIAQLTKEDEEEVQATLENGTLLPLVLVSPVELMERTEGIPVSGSVVDEYAEEWDSGTRFPPVIINSVSEKDALIEGAHRTASAIQAGIGMIEAIDIADIRVVTIKGVKVYDFKHARREPS